MSLPNPLYGFVLEDGLRENSGNSGRYYHYSTLRTSSGLVKTRIWSASQDKIDIYPHKGDIVLIDDFKDQLEIYDSIVLYNYRKIAKEQLPESERVICEYPKHSRAEVVKALQYIVDPKLYNDINNRSLVNGCFSLLNLEDLFSYPAGEKMHHTLGGGLMIHTSQVVRIAKGICDACEMPFINNDVVVVGAALHDIGKFKTYTIDEFGNPGRLVIERTIGHMCLGIELVRGVGFDILANQDFVDEVCHCIAAHHGRPEYGNIKPIQSMEALIVHMADLLSSRNDMLDNKLRDAIEGGIALPDTFNMASDSYFATLGMKNYIKSKATL